MGWEGRGDGRRRNDDHIGLQSFDVANVEVDFHRDEGVAGLGDGEVGVDEVGVGGGFDAAVEEEPEGAPDGQVLTKRRQKSRAQILKWRQRGARGVLNLLAARFKLLKLRRLRELSALQESARAAVAQAMAADLHQLRQQSARRVLLMFVARWKLVKLRRDKARALATLQVTILADLEPACSFSSDAVIDALRTLEVGTAALAALKARQAALDVFQPPQLNRPHSLLVRSTVPAFLVRHTAPHFFTRLKPDSDLVDARRRIKGPFG